MWGYYLFALFVFVLCVVLVLFAKFLFSAKRKPEDLKMQEEKLLRLYRQIEDMMESFEEYAEEVRGEIAEQKKDIMNQISGCEARLGKKIDKEIADKTKKFEKPVFHEITSENVIKPTSVSASAQAKKEAPMAAQAEELEKMKKELEKKQENVEKENKSDAGDVGESRNETIVRLHKEGKSENEIAKQMNMNSSEIRLIIGMNSR